MFKQFAAAALSLAAFVLTAAAPLPEPGTLAPIPGLIPPPAVVADPSNKWTLELSTGGTVTILLRPDLAPANVARIKELTQRHFYDGLVFHRVIPGFMAQGGDPKGTGEGGSELPDLKAEFSAVPFMRGTVGMARTDDPNTANSQFFITFVPYPTLDHNYTVVGRVISGMTAVDGMAVGEPPADPTKIVKASIGG